MVQNLLEGRGGVAENCGECLVWRCGCAADCNASANLAGARHRGGTGRSFTYSLHMYAHVIGYMLRAACHMQLSHYAISVQQLARHGPLPRCATVVTWVSILILTLTRALQLKRTCTIHYATYTTRLRVVTNTYTYTHHLPLLVSSRCPSSPACSCV